MKTGLKTGRIFWGLFFVIAAIVLIVNRIGMWHLDISLFKLLVTIFLAACLIKSITYRNVSGILFSIAFLCILYDNLLGITHLTPWTVLGSALLGSIGFSILFRPKNDYYTHHHHSEHFDSTETVEGDSIILNTSFASSIKYISSDDFKAADIRCTFGGMKVYFDNAIIKNGNAVLHLDVSFAGIEIYIPKEWNIVNNASVSFAGIEEKNRNASTGTPTLRLTGGLSFGGVTIIYV